METGNTSIMERKEEHAAVVVNAETLISQAIDKGMPVDMMERLLKMRSELNAEHARNEFARALSSFQSSCPVIKKGDEAKETNGNVRYSYASIGDISKAVAPLLEKNGLSYTFKTKQDKESVTAICIIKHSAGHSEETEFTIPIDPKAYMNAAQKVASALTYAKRYAFVNAFGIMTGDEDDDANATGAPKKETAKQDQNFAVHPKNGKSWRLASDNGLIAAYAKLAQDYQVEIGKVLTERGFAFENGAWTLPIAKTVQHDSLEGNTLQPTKIIDATASEVQSSGDDPHSAIKDGASFDDKPLPFDGK